MPYSVAEKGGGEKKKKKSATPLGIPSEDGMPQSSGLKGEVVLSFKVIWQVMQ